MRQSENQSPKIVKNFSLQLFFDWDAALHCGISTYTQCMQKVVGPRLSLILLGEWNTSWELMVNSCIVMRSDWKRNEIGLVPLGPFWDRHWLIFLSSKATAFIYLGDLKARGLVIVASCFTPNLTIRTNESSTSLQLSDQSFFELYFPWEANLHLALPKSSMTQCFSNSTWIPIFKWRKGKDIVVFWKAISLFF